MQGSTNGHFFALIWLNVAEEFAKIAILHRLVENTSKRECDFPGIQRPERPGIELDGFDGFGQLLNGHVSILADRARTAAFDYVTLGVCLLSPNEPT